MTVSVLISAYNRPHYIGEALQSVLDSTYKDVDIIVRNSSDEDYRDAVDRIVSSFPVTLLHGKNRGPAHSANALIEASNGDVIVILNDDDAVKPTLIERSLELLPTCELVLSQVEFMDESGKPFESEDHPWFKMKQARNGTRDAWKYELHGGTPFAGGWMHRRSLTKKIGGADEGLWHLGDLDFYQRVIEIGDIKVIEEPLYKFRIHPGNTSWAGEENRFLFDAELKRIRRRYYTPKVENCPSTLSVLEAL